VNDHVMGTSPVSSEAMASNVPVDRSREADEEHPGHLQSVLATSDFAQGNRIKRGRTDSSATVAVTLFPLLVLVIVTVLPQSWPVPYISVCRATIRSESWCVVPQAPAFPSSASMSPKSASRFFRNLWS
jgi:hypothetical protein